MPDDLRQHSRALITSVDAILADADDLLDCLREVRPILERHRQEIIGIATADLAPGALEREKAIRWIMAEADKHRDTTIGNPRHPPLDAIGAAIAQLAFGLERLEHWQ
jgi:hypothetical protein